MLVQGHGATVLERGFPILALDEFGTATDSFFTYIYIYNTLNTLCGLIWYYGITVNPTKYPQDSLSARTLSLKLLARFAPRHPSLGRGAIRWVEDFCAKTAPSMIKAKPK